MQASQIPAPRSTAGRGRAEAAVGARLVVAMLTATAAVSVVVADDDPVAVPASTASAQDADGRDLAVRYARARLRLAEVDLERALAVNERSHAAIGRRDVERLRTHVEVLRRQVEVARAQPRTAARQVAIAAAESARDVASVDLERALAANRRSPGAVSAVNLRRLEAMLDLADVRVQMCRSAEHDLSLLAEMQWSIERLTEEVIDLRHAVDAQGTRDFSR